MQVYLLVIQCLAGLLTILIHHMRSNQSKHQESRVVVDTCKVLCGCGVSVIVLCFNITQLIARASIFLLQHGAY